MAERHALRDPTAFLAAAGWGAARRSPLAGDASARRYERLRLGGTTAVLMDAPPGTGNDLGPFLAIARHLGGLGLSAPRILAADEAAGFLLLEDLGDALFASVVADDPRREEELYAAATDLLAELHRHPPPRGLSPFDAPTLGALTGIALEWYAPAPEAERRALAQEVADLATRLAPGTPVLMLRDFHAENLVWLPGRAGPARVGLLDFQDAQAGHPAYDLVSLTEDARRDLSPGLRDAMLARYARTTGQDAQGFAAAAALLAAQRNLRILGVFARLCLRDGKTGYLDLMPRVWGHLQRDLAHPALAPLARRLASLPEPSPARLAAFREEAGCRRVPS